MREMCHWKIKLFVIYKKKHIWGWLFSDESALKSLLTLYRSKLNVLMKVPLLSFTDIAAADLENTQ